MPCQSQLKKHRTGVASLDKKKKHTEDDVHAAEPFANKTLQMSEDYKERYERLNAITPRGLQTLIDKILRAVLGGRPLVVKLFIADFLDAELARRTFKDIVCGCHLKKSVRDPLYPTESCLLLRAELLPPKRKEPFVQSISEQVDAFSKGPVPLYGMKAPALDRYRQLTDVGSLFDVNPSGNNVDEKVDRTYDENPYVEGVSASSLSIDEGGACLADLLTCACEYCAMKVARKTKQNAEFDVHVFHGKGCADYTWYPCYQYSSVPVPGCDGRPIPTAHDEHDDGEGEEEDDHHGDHHGDEKHVDSGEHVSVRYDVFGETYLTQPEELSGENFTTYGDAEHELFEATYDHERLFTEPDSSPTDEVFGPSFEQDTPFDDHLQPEHSQGEQDFMKEHVDVDAHMVDFVEYALHKGDPAEQDTSVDYSMMLSGEGVSDGSASGSTHQAHQAVQVDAIAAHVSHDAAHFDVLDIHVVNAEGCANYTTYPCYQYSSIPVPGCEHKPTS